MSAAVTAYVVVPAPARPVLARRRGGLVSGEEAMSSISIALTETPSRSKGWGAYKCPALEGADGSNHRRGAAFDPWAAPGGLDLRYLDAEVGAGLLRRGCARNVGLTVRRLREAGGGT